MLMNKTSNSIEVEKTKFFDCRKAMIDMAIIKGVLYGLFAIFTHYYLLGFILFLIGGIIHPSYFINLRTPFRFEFINGFVLIYYRAFKKTKMKKVPFERFYFIKQYWHNKRNDQEYTVDYSDAKNKSFYWIFMPSLHSWTHWDKDALDYLLYLAEQNGIAIKRWDYPIRWGS